MWRSLADNRLAATMAIVTFLAVAIHNAATHHDVEDRASNNRSPLPICYGWLMPCAEGQIDIEAYTLSTFPPQFWASTWNLKPRFVGIAANLLIGLILVCSVFVGTRWLQSRLRLQFSISTPLGITTFAALCIHLRIQRWHWLHDTIGDYPRLDLTHTFFEYAEIIVWLAVFAACVWLPHLIQRRLRRQSQREPTDFGCR